MHLIVNISELQYEAIMKSKVLKDVKADYIRNAIVLPKEHGRLIDAKDAIETLQIMFAEDEDIQNACEQCISDCPTVIESDKENKE